MENEIICYCSQVTKQEILQSIKDGAKTLQDVRKKTNACTIGNCKKLNPKKICCSGDIIEIIGRSAPLHSRGSL